MHSPGWLQTQYVAQFYFQLLIFLSLPAKLVNYRHGLVYLVLCHAGHQTQGFSHARLTLYPVRNPSPNICVLAAGKQGQKYHCQIGAHWNPSTS